MNDNFILREIIDSVFNPELKKITLLLSCGHTTVYDFSLGLIPILHRKTHCRLCSMQASKKKK